MNARRLLVFGLGFAGRVAARRFREAGWEVVGTVRTEEARAAAATEGFEAILFDGKSPLPDAPVFLKSVTHVLTTVPPDEDGRDAVLGLHGRDLARASSVEWVGHLSSTAVYGDSNGEWVGETAWLKPTNERGRRRVAVERAWLDLCRADFLAVHVFRLPGIYGPGRDAIDALRAGRARRIVKPGHVMSRIHVEDLASTLLASVAKPNPGGIYNVADDLPAPSHEVTAFAASLLGVEPPPEENWETAEMSPMLREFYADSRKIKNDRVKNRLGVTLRYPDYKAGLTARVEMERFFRGDREESGKRCR